MFSGEEVKEKEQVEEESENNERGIWEGGKKCRLKRRKGNN